MSKVEYGIYKLSNQNKISADINIEVLHQRIKLADVLFRAREAYSLIGKKSALMWWVISFGKAKMYYVKDSLTGGDSLFCLYSKQVEISAFAKC